MKINKKLIFIIISCILIITFSSCKNSNERDNSIKEQNETNLIEDNYDWVED